MNGSRLTAAFEAALRQKRCALIPFIMAGDPDLDTTRLVLKALEETSDIIELGIPYSDPLADGPSIVAASQRSLQGGTTLERALELIKDVKVPVVVFAYANPMMQYGKDKLVARLLEVGAAGLIIPDLPLEETIVISHSLGAAGIDVPLLIAPTTTAIRAQRIVNASKGFVYLVSRLGVTGAADAQRPDPAVIALQANTLRTMTSLPIAVGFGLSQREQVAAIAQIADGAIVGSALIDALAGLASFKAAERAGSFVADLYQGTTRR